MKTFKIILVILFFVVIQLSCIAQQKEVPVKKELNKINIEKSELDINSDIIKGKIKKINDRQFKQKAVTNRRMSASIQRKKILRKDDVNQNP